MIERLQRIATFLAHFRLGIVILNLMFLTLVLTSLFELELVSEYELLMPSLAAFLWTLILYSLSVLFVAVPILPGKGAGFRERLSVALRRGGIWILAVLMLVLSFALLILTYELLRTWFMN